MPEKMEELPTRYLPKALVKEALDALKKCKKRSDVKNIDWPLFFECCYDAFRRMRGSMDIGGQASFAIAHYSILKTEEYHNGARKILGIKTVEYSRLF